MRTKKLLFIIPLLLWGMITFAQQTVITGTVVGEDGSPLPGASVQVKGTSSGTVTDVDGKFSLSLDISTSPVLVVSYVGYLSEEVTVGNQTNLTVTLTADIKSLDEIVVIGYGVTKKSLVTGSISKVGSDEITQTKNLRLEQALQGKVAGVDISQASGSPGAGMTVRIRGVSSNSNSDPLYVVDGIKVGGIEDLNPNDIKSIEILKDAASAAIYGSEAANGVVLITTKTGEVGAKATASYNGYFGYNTPTLLKKVLNSEQYVKYFKEAYAQEKMYQNWQSGTILDRNDPAVISFVNKNMPYNEDTVGTGTDWMKEITNPGKVQSHNLSFSGGTDKSAYYLSLGYYDEEGIIGGNKSDFKRYTVDLNGSHQVNKWLNVHAKLNFVNHVRTNINENDEFGGVVAMAEEIDPLTPVYFDNPSQLPKLDSSQLALVPMNGDKYYGLSNLVTNEIANPVAWISLIHKNYNLYKALGNFGATVKIFKGLTYHPSISFEKWNSVDEDWKPAYYFHGLKNDPKSYIWKEDKGGLKIFWDEYLDYAKTFGDHSIDVVIGNSFEHYTEKTLGATNKMLLYENPNFAFLNQAQQPDSIIPKPWDGYNETVMISYIGRFSYNYKEKYLFSATVRRDASNKFGKNNRVGTFPSVSAGYVISREDFWKIPMINFLKLRGSWGRNGSTSSLGNWDWTSTISFENNRYLMGNTLVNGARPSRSSNPDLRWEQSDQLDFGLDAGLLRNRIFLTADYFKKTTIDLLIDGTPPLYTGNLPPKVNAGNVRNSGVELELTLNDTKGDFNYSVSFNSSYIKNKVIKLTKDVTRLTGTSVGIGQGTINLFEEGEPAWYFYGYKTDGVFHNTDEIKNYVNADGQMYQPNAIPGDVKFLDINGVDSLGNPTGQPDGTIDDNDRTYLGQPQPKWSFGFNVNLGYKGFDLAMLWQAVTGNSIYNGSYRSDLGRNNKPLKYWTDRWDPANPNADNGWFRATVLDKNRNFRPSDLFVENGSYLKLRQLMIGYTLPSKLTSKFMVQKLRIYISGNNLLTFTHYSSGDPEIGQTDTWSANNAIDRGFYPSAKSYKLGVSVNF